MAVSVSSRRRKWMVRPLLSGGGIGKAVTLVLQFSVWALGNRWVWNALKINDDGP